LQFLLFGLLHGFYLTVNHALRTFRGNAKPSSNGAAASIRRIANVLATYVAVVIGLVLFRSPSLEHAFAMFRGMFGLHGLTASVKPMEIAWLLGLAILVWGCPNVQQIMDKFAPVLGKVEASTSRLRLIWRPNFRWACAVGLLAAASLLAMGGTSEFMYFQF